MKYYRPIALIFILFFIFFAPLCQPIFASTEFIFFPNTSDGHRQLDQEQIVDILNNNFELESEDSEYYKVNIKMLYDEKGNPDYFIAYFLSKASYLYDTSKIELTGKYTVQEIIFDYVAVEEDFRQEPASNHRASCPDESVEMVFYNEVTEWPNPVQCIKDLKAIAQQAGYTYATFIGSQATVENYKDWLECKNLKMMAGIAHGSKNGIALRNGTLRYTHFDSLQNNALDGLVLWTTSCQVFNHPFKTSVIGAGVRKYIGGITNLYSGPAERTLICGIKKFIAQKEITPSVQICNDQYAYGIHGVGGNGTEYLDPPGQISATSQFLLFQ